MFSTFIQKGEETVNIFVLWYSHFTKNTWLHSTAKSGRSIRLDLIIYLNGRNSSVWAIIKRKFVWKRISFVFCAWFLRLSDFWKLAGKKC